MRSRCSRELELPWNSSTDERRSLLPAEIVSQTTPARRSSVFQLDADDANLERIDVLERVRRLSTAPDCGAGLRQGAGFARVDKDGAFAIAAHEMAEREDIEDGRPSMRMHLGDLSRPDPRLQNSRDLALEQQTMRLGRCRQCVERIGPGPSLRLSIAHDERTYWVPSGNARKTSRRFLEGLESDQLSTRRQVCRSHESCPLKASTANAWQRCSARCRATSGPRACRPRRSSFSTIRKPSSRS